MVSPEIANLLNFKVPAWLAGSGFKTAFVSPDIFVQLAPLFSLRCHWNTIFGDLGAGCANRTPNLYISGKLCVFELPFPLRKVGTLPAIGPLFGS